MTIRRKLTAFIGVGMVTVWAAVAQALPPRYDHVVIVVEENHSPSDIIGNADAPYINSLAAAGTSLASMHALIHPSQPNYLQLFSGSAQNVISDLIPENPQAKPTTTNPFITPNLAAELRGAGLSFGGYSQTLPSIGSQVATSTDYARKHVPWTNWQNNAWTDDAHPPAAPLANTLPQSVNMPFTSFPASANYSTLPTLSFVVPDLQNDMHNGTVAQADAWLKSNIDPYYQWAQSHNSLLIVTWDEDDLKTGETNAIPTLFAGARVKAGGVVAQPYTLHDLLRTVEDIYALPHAGSAAQVRPIAGPFTTDPDVNHVTFRQGVAGYIAARDTQIREAAPTVSYAATTALAVDGDDDDAAGNQRAQTLLRFDNIIAGAGGVIPADATILSAKLTLYTTNLTANPVKLHRMITGWTDAATWTSAGGGIVADGIKAAAASDFDFAPPLLNNTVYFDVSDTLQQWVDGKAANNGWAILPTGTDGFALASSESTTAAYRPTLDVSYALYPRFSATGGSWNTAGNWANGTPNAAGAVARLLARAAATAITLDGNKSVGTLLIDSPSAYTLNPGSGGMLTFANNGNVAALQVQQGQHTLAVPISFIDSGSLDIAPAAKLTVTAGLSLDAGKTLIKLNPGTMQISGGMTLGTGAAVNVNAGELRADSFTGAGSLTVRSGAAARLTATNSQASTLTSLSIDGATGAWTGTMDLGKSGLVINYTGASPLAVITDQIKSARAGHWTAPGIGSTAAATDPTSAIGIAEASTLLGLSSGQTAQFMGQTVDSTSLLIRYTKSGDANLDGKVDFADLVKVAQNYGAPGAGAWSRGDFTYDGIVNFSDLVTIAQNYNAVLPADPLLSFSPTFSADLQAASVPEPSLLNLLVLIPLLIARRNCHKCGQDIGE